MSPNELIDFMLRLETAVEADDAADRAITPTEQIVREMLGKWNKGEQ